MVIDFFKDYWAAIIGNIVALGILGWGISTLVSTNLNRSIEDYKEKLKQASDSLDAMLKLGHDKVLKDYEFQLKNREEAASVSKLLAMAFHMPVAGPAEFNQLAWELSLWLLAPIVIELSKTLVGVPGAIDPKEILIMVRVR